MLPISYIEIREKDHLESVFYIRVTVYQIANRMNQFDHECSSSISWCSLASKNECTRRYINGWISLNTHITCQDIQYIKMLPFILMNALYLYIEHRRRINDDACPLFDQCCKELLIFQFYIPELFTKSGIPCKKFKFMKFIKLPGPFITN